MSSTLSHGLATNDGQIPPIFTSKPLSRGSAATVAISAQVVLYDNTRVAPVVRTSIVWP
jgi:hypothetical protein